MLHWRKPNSITVKTLKAFAVAVAFMFMAGCGPHIGWYSNYEIADGIAKEQGPDKAEEWLAKVMGPEKARGWRERYDRTVKAEREETP